MRLREVPIVFRDRVKGQSKIGPGQMVAYVRRLAVLSGGAVSLSNATRFAGVGVVGLFIDLMIFELLFGTGFALTTSHTVSFAVATLFNYALNSRWAFADGSDERRGQDWHLYLRFLTVCILALSLRGGVLAGAVELFGWPVETAIVLGVGAAAIVNYLGCAFFVFPSLSPRVPSDIRWRVAAIGVLAYALVLRLVFIGLVDLLPEEAYYWNYAQHLDIGYLDHPPMVAWLIWLGTRLFGDTEFGVRIAASATWLATAFFVFQLTRNLFGKSAAFVGVLLVASLPFFFAMGLMMVPDAPLTAAWAGALYFLERALIGQRRRAWWGVGICAGLGMLSKYTIALLGPATLLFILLDPRARRWLLRPEPYLAMILGALLFSPVIVWNAGHDWASFAFQSSRRIQDSVTFALPSLVGAALVLLTPFGLLSAGLALRSAYRQTGATGEEGATRRALFVVVYTLVPLSVFVAFSVLHATRLNWTGPLWLAALPAVAATIAATGDAASRLDLRLQRLWVPSVMASLAIYGLGLHYLVLGLPVAGYAGNLRTLPVAWEEFGRQASALQREVGQAGVQEPLLIGMDTYFLASEMAFYDQDDDGAASSVGRGVLGGTSLMYDYWFAPDEMRGRTAILLALKRTQIEDPSLDSRFSRLGDVLEEDVMKDGKYAGRFFYRVGYDLRSPLDRSAVVDSDGSAGS